MESGNAMPVGAAKLPAVGNKLHDPQSFTIPEKVFHFLTDRFPEAYCDDCLAAALHLRRTQVNTVTSTLGLCREYSRGIQPCKTCTKEGKTATRRDSL